MSAVFQCLVFSQVVFAHDEEELFFCAHFLQIGPEQSSLRCPGRKLFDIDKLRSVFPQHSRSSLSDVAMFV